MANQEVRDDGEPPETTPQWHTLECVDPGYYATTRTRSLLIFLLLSLQTFAQSLMATCIFVILPVCCCFSFLPLPSLRKALVRSLCSFSLLTNLLPFPLLHRLSRTIPMPPSSRAWVSASSTS